MHVMQLPDVYDEKPMASEQMEIDEVSAHIHEESATGFAETAV